MLLEILRFNRQAVAGPPRPACWPSVSLGEYLACAAIRDRFRDDYLIPMGAAIWSMSPPSMLAFPAESFVAFFEQPSPAAMEPAGLAHGDGRQPQLCREAGSERFRDQVRLGSGVTLSASAPPTGVDGHRRDRPARTASTR